MKKMNIFAAAMLTLTLLAVPTMSLAADAGADVYKAKCMSCHGADGAKLAKANLTTTTMSEADLEAMIADGGKDKKPMHAFSKKGMTPEQVKAVAAYVKSLKK